ncbi:nitrous oxide reductase family maturation protein NosD, partial [Patescibacteria group bacterium]
TNQTASQIESLGPFSIVVGESSENNNLTLKTYGTGNIIFNNDGTITSLLSDEGKLILGDSTPVGMLTVDTTNTATFGKAAVIIDHDESQDILTASASGTTRLTLNTDGDLLPGTDDDQDLGSSTLRWQDLYLGPGSINIGTNGNFALISYDTTSNYLAFDPDGDSTNELFLYDSGSLRLIASSYLNWGATEGSSGYGIRDNSGNMEFKDSGGDWAQIATQSAAFERAKYDRIVDCNGGGTDTTVQGAIDNASSGDSIYIAPCTYTENVTIDKELKLFGAGAGATIINAASSGSAAVTIANGIDNVEIHNLEITNSYSANTDHGIENAGTSPHDYIVINNVEISGGYNGIVHNHGYGIKITNNYIHDVTASGIYFAQDGAPSVSSYGLVSNNNVVNAGTHGIYITEGHDFVRIANNSIREWNSNNYAIWVGFSDNVGITGNTIDGVTTSGRGIQLSWVNQSSITGNTIANYDADTGGIDTYNCNDLTIAANNIYNGTAGIYVNNNTSSTRIAITGNNISGMSGYAIDLVDSNTTNVTVTGNTLVNNTSGAITNNLGVGNRVFANNTDDTGALAEEFSIYDSAADTTFNFTNPDGSFVADMALEGDFTVSGGDITGAGSTGIDLGEAFLQYLLLLMRLRSHQR